MRILYLIDNFSLGGAQTVIKGLMESGVASDTAWAIALREKEPVMTMDHPHVITFPSRSKYTFRVVRFLKDFIAEKNIEILHCQLPRSIVIGYLIKRAIPGITFIIHEQGDVFESRTYALLLRTISKRANGIMACSKATANMLMRRSHVDPTRIKVLYNFVDLERFRPARPSSDRVKKIGFAGRIEKRKGWREFIKAANGLRQRKELSFYLAGTGTEQKKLTRAIEKLKHSHISYVGFVGDMTSFYREMDLLVIPSHFEPMGMVAVEAMACGTPVLASNVPGLNEVVDHEVNGWRYSGRTAEALRHAIEGILDGNPEDRSSIREQGIKDAGSYALNTYIQKLQKYYGSIT
mgnify:FL=1